MSNDLLSRLSAATGPSRELDAEIALACGWTVEPPYTSIATTEFRWKSPAWQIFPRPPRFTKSIGAVLTLVPIIAGPKRGLWVRLQESVGAHGTSGCHWQAELWGLIGEESFSFIGYHVSPAIALVIACLKAKEDSK